MLGIRIGNVDGITLGLIVETALGCLGGSFDGYNDGNHEGLLVGG